MEADIYMLPSCYIHYILFQLVFLLMLKHDHR